MEFAKDPVTGTWQSTDVTKLIGHQGVGAAPLLTPDGAVRVYAGDENRHLRESAKPPASLGWYTTDISAQVGCLQPLTAPVLLLTPDGIEHIYTVRQDATGSYVLVEFSKALGVPWQVTNIFSPLPLFSLSTTMIMPLTVRGGLYVYLLDTGG